jgi:MT0933-like antitoxin protein
MGLMDSVKKLAKNKNQVAKVAAGVDKATDLIDKKTGGKHHDKLQKVDDAVAKAAGTKTPPAQG